MVEAGESEYAVALKIHKLLKKRVAHKTPKTQKLGLTGTYLERGNLAFLRLFAGKDEGGLSLPLPRSRVACCSQIMLVKRLPDQGLDYRLAADV